MGKKRSKKEIEKARRDFILQPTATQTVEAARSDFVLQPGPDPETIEKYQSPFDLLGTFDIPIEEAPQPTVAAPAEGGAPPAAIDPMEGLRDALGVTDPGEVKAGIGELEMPEYIVNDMPVTKEDVDEFLKLEGAEEALRSGELNISVKNDPETEANLRSVMEISVEEPTVAAATTGVAPKAQPLTEQQLAENRAEAEKANIEAEKTKQEHIEAVERNPAMSFIKAAGEVYQYQAPAAIATLESRFHAGKAKEAQANTLKYGEMDPGKEVEIPSVYKGRKKKVTAEEATEYWADRTMKENHVMMKAINFAVEKNEGMKKSDLVRSWANVKDAVDVINFISSSIGNVAGQLPLMVATAGTTPFMLEGGLMYLEGVTKVMEETGLSSEEIMSKGLDNEAAAAAYALIAGTLDVAGAGKILKSMGITKELLQSSFRKRVLTSSLWEGGTEGAQSMLTSIGSARLAGKSTAEAIKSIEGSQVFDEFSAGLFGGGGIVAGQAGIQAVTKAPDKIQKKIQDVRERAKEKQEPVTVGEPVAEPTIEPEPKPEPEGVEEVAPKEADRPEKPGIPKTNEVAVDLYDQLKELSATDIEGAEEATAMVEQYDATSEDINEEWIESADKLLTKHKDAIQISKTKKISLGEQAGVSEEVDIGKPEEEIEPPSKPKVEKPVEPEVKAVTKKEVVSPKITKPPAEDIKKAGEAKLKLKKDDEAEVQLGTAILSYLEGSTVEDEFTNEQHPERRKYVEKLRESDPALYAETQAGRLRVGNIRRALQPLATEGLLEDVPSDIRTKAETLLKEVLETYSKPETTKDQQKEMAARTAKVVEAYADYINKRKVEKEVEPIEKEKKIEEPKPEKIPTKEKLETGEKGKSDYIKRRIKDLNDKKEFTKKVEELGNYNVQSFALSNKESDKLISEAQKEFGEKEGLSNAFELLKHKSLPSIMVGPLSSKLILKMQKAGMSKEALEVVDWKQETLREVATVLTGARANASPEETVSRIFAGLEGERQKALEQEFKKGETYEGALKEIQTRLTEVEKAYQELVKKGEMEDRFFPKPKTPKSTALRQRAKALRKEGLNDLSKYFKSQRETLSMGVRVDADLLNGLSKVFYSYVLEFEGNVAAAYEKFRQNITDQYSEISKKDIDSIKESLMKQNEEGINEFKLEKKRQVVADILKPEGKETAAQRSERKSVANDIVDDIEQGKTIEEVAEKLSPIAGFKQISQEDTDIILDLTEKYSQYSMEGKLELAHNAWTKLMIKLGDLKLKTRAAHEVILNIWYTHVLSGLTTLARSIFGSFTTTVMHTITRLMASPKAAPFMFSRMIEGSKGSWQNYLHVLKTGQTNVNITDFTPKLPPYLSEILAKPFKELGVRDKIEKVISAIPTYVFRNIVAFDQILKNVVSEGNIALFEFEKTDKGKAVKERVILAEKAISADKKQEIEKMVTEEIAEIKAKGERVEIGYANRRAREIRDSLNDIELVKRATYDASEAALVSTPRGTLGMMYNAWINAIEIEKGDKFLGQVWKIGARSIFPFIRVSFNWINAGLDYTPIGIARAFSSRRWTKDGYKKTEPYEKRELMARAALGMAVGALILANMFDWDEDEGFKLKPDKDTWIKIYGPLTGKWWEEKDIASDAKPWSVRFRNPPTGEWSKAFQYRDNPIGFIMAPIGIMHDEVVFKDFKAAKKAEDVKHEVKKMEYLLGAWAQGTFRYAMDQSFNQGIRNISRIAYPRNEEERAKNIGNLFYRPTEGFVPGIYKQLYNQYKAISDIPEKEYKTWYERPAKLFPIVDGILQNHKYDVFGYPIVKDFDFPLIPDMILQSAKENLYYRENYKEWKLLHKYEEVAIGGFLAPRKYKGRKLTEDERNEFLMVAGLKMRELVNKSYDYLNKIDKFKLQGELTKRKNKAYNYAKKKIDK